MPQIIQTAASPATLTVSVDRRLLGVNTKAVVSHREYSKIAADGVGAALIDLGPGLLFSAPVLLNSITVVGTAVATITPGFVGRVVSAFAVVTTAVTTGGKLAPVGVYIDAVVVNGGTIGLTSGNATPVGAVVPGSLVVDQARTGTNQFSKTGVITFRLNSAATAFTEGAVMFGVLVAPARKGGPVTY